MKFKTKWYGCATFFTAVDLPKFYGKTGSVIKKGNVKEGRAGGNLLHTNHKTLMCFRLQEGSWKCPSHFLRHLS